MDQTIKNIFDRLLERPELVDESMSLDKLAMARNQNEKSLRDRGLNWQRFIEGASAVPSLMKYDIDRRIADYRTIFAPYVQGPATPATTNMLKMMHAGFSGMVFAYFAQDDAIGVDDYHDLYEDNDPAFGRTPQEQEATKKMLKRLGDFVMAKGVKVLPAQVPGQNDPANKLYGNLSDQHISDFGYAFKGIDGVKVRKGDVTRSRTAPFFNPTKWMTPVPRKRIRAGDKPQLPDPADYAKVGPSDALWVAAERAYQVKPNEFTQMNPDGSRIGKLAELEVHPDSKGNFAPYLMFKRIDPKTGMLVVQKKEPLLAAGADINDDESFKGYYTKFMKAGTQPGASFVWLPEGPGEGKPIQLVHGDTNAMNKMLQGHQQAMSRGEQSPFGPDLELFEDKHLGQEVSGFDRYRSRARMRADKGKKDPNSNMPVMGGRNEQIWRIVFDGEEGGLLLQNDIDDKKIVPMSKSQVEQLINWGQDANNIYKNPADEKNYIKRLIHVYPPTQAVDLDGKPKSPGLGRWDMSEQDKAKLRASMKSQLDLLSKTLTKYYHRREVEKMTAKGQPVPNKLAPRHTATQGWVWVLITPRYENPEIISKIKGRTTGKGVLYNPNRDVIHNQPMAQQQSPAPAAPAAMPSPVATADGHDLLMKLSQAYGGMGIGGAQTDETYEGVRDWIVVSHNLQPERLQETGAKRGPHETIGGKLGDTLTSAHAAIDRAFNHFAIPEELKPDPQELEDAQNAFLNAGKEIAEKHIVPDVNNEATLTEQGLWKQKSERQEAEEQEATGEDTVQPIDKPVEHPLTDRGETMLDLFGNVIEMKKRRQRRRPMMAPPMQQNPLGTAAPTPVGTPPPPKKKPAKPAPTGPTLFDPIGAEASSYLRQMFKKYGL